MTEQGKKTMVNAAKVLAMTAADYLTSPEFRTELRAQFDASLGK